MLGLRTCHGKVVGADSYSKLLSSSTNELVGTVRYLVYENLRAIRRRIDVRRARRTRAPPISRLSP